MKHLNLILTAALILLLAFSLALGPYEVGPANWLLAFTGGGDKVDTLVIWQIRLPRGLLALTIGAGLGASGAALQGLLRNPLADPAVVGISSTASLFAVIMLYFGVKDIFAPAVFLAAMSGAAFAAVFLLVLARLHTSVTGLILGGVALSALSTALTGLLMNLSANPWALSEIAYWLMGSVADRSYNDLAIALPLVLAGIAVLHLAAPGLDALGLGEDMAFVSGYPVRTTGFWVVLGTLLCVGAGVAIAGAIGFVGLAAPHLVRPFVAYKPGALLLPSALVGGGLLLLADMVVRALSGGGSPLYLGVITALLGAPMFLWLVWKTRSELP